MAEKKLEPVTEKRGILYEITRVLAHIVFHTLMPVKFHHRKRLLQDPPFVLIANHRHALDPVAMAMGIPHVRPLAHSAMLCSLCPAFSVEGSPGPHTCRAGPVTPSRGWQVGRRGPGPQGL